MERDPWRGKMKNKSVEVDVILSGNLSELSKDTGGVPSILRCQIK